ncbi:SET domain-containing protein [Polychaeton citri CBS 116435]|uniref:SET domain-containing protein n=1 Tax=Polychaeton citri CBS 116435 TaxID=1314669 RepID=A0A9P4Q2M3_9PEZI|nr:SET domain-containing protein [Polychaeton citri CBS 116435]
MLRTICGGEAVKQWLICRPQPKCVLLGTPLTEVRSAGQGRGLGLFAAQTIRECSEILSESPLILMKPSDDLPQLWSQYQELSNDQKSIYDNLSFPSTPQRDTLLASKLRERNLAVDGNGNEQMKEMVRVANIMQTNAFNVDMADSQGARHRALFPNVARINHSCMPNAHVCFYDPNTVKYEDGKGRMIIHALRDIAPGEEVVISYFSILLPKEVRQERARKWSFECLCPACTDEISRDEDIRSSISEFLATYKLAMTERTKGKERLLASIDDGKFLAQRSIQLPYLRPSLPDIWDAVGMLHAGLNLKDPQASQQQDISQALEASALAEARITGRLGPPAKRRLNKLADFAGKEGAEPFMEVDVEGWLAISWAG